MAQVAWFPSLTREIWIEFPRSWVWPSPSCYEQLGCEPADRKACWLSAPQIKMNNLKTQEVTAGMSFQHNDLTPFSTKYLVGLSAATLLVFQNIPARSGEDSCGLLCSCGEHHPPSPLEWPLAAQVRILVVYIHTD